jgi:hypothetical protein
MNEEICESFVRDGDAVVDDAQGPIFGRDEVAADGEHGCDLLFLEETKRSGRI